MEITVRVPTLLRDSAGGQCEFVLAASTLEAALARLRAEYPLLSVHLWDEADQLRPHVLLFYNGDNIKWLAGRDIALRPGDQLEILQAVSGG